MAMRCQLKYTKVLTVLLGGLIINYLTFRVCGQPQPATEQKATTQWEAHFIPSEITVHMDTSAVVKLNITNIDTSLIGHRFVLRSEHPHIGSVDLVIPLSQVDTGLRSWHGNVTVDAHFLGVTQVYVELVDAQSSVAQAMPEDKRLSVIVIRRTRAIDHIFTGSVALLVSLLYINFGAALDVSVLRGLLSRPVGPTIGFLSQFLLMPVLSYGLGLLIFPDSVEMQLGLFFTGVSPSGGASNIWTVMLDGNINLSVLMTTISNVAAFATMPIWIFSLGSVIFERGDLGVPYWKIATYSVALVVPLAIGLAIQRYSPRLTRLLVRLLKPVSTCLILFIIIFAIVTNLYLFELFSWEIVVAATALPWLGYCLAWLTAKALRQHTVDAMTIAIETGIQNTGISIFLLRFSLPQPQADLTTVVPVAVAIMTPFPLLALYLYKRFVKGSSAARSLRHEETRPTVEEQQQQQHQPVIKSNNSYNSFNNS